MSTFTLVDSIEAYDALIADHCLAASVADVAGVPRHMRFEQLTSEQIASLNEWFFRNGTCVVLRLTSTAMCLHVLGAREVDPAKESFNLELGKGKEKTYYWCEANAHNRIVKQGNLGSLSKEGLIYDMVNQYYGLGPAAHIDCYGMILSLQHRTIAKIMVNLELGDDAGTETPIDMVTIVGMPPQLAATLDRGAPKTKQDQEFIDREMFTREFLEESCGLEYVPENVEKLRNELAGYLVTVRNNLWSRLHGTGYHPSGKNSPSTRQALALQSCFDDVGEGDSLQRLIARVWARSMTEDGKKGLWVKQLSVPMIATAIVLASNSEADKWEDGSAITIDETTADSVLNALGVVSDEGNAGLSNYVREVAKIRKMPKKPSGLERWIFWGFTATVSDLLGDGVVEQAYFPVVNDTLLKRLKNGKASYPIFGGMDTGPQAAESSDE